MKINEFIITISHRLKFFIFNNTEDYGFKLFKEMIGIDILGVKYLEAGRPEQIHRSSIGFKEKIKSNRVNYNK